LTWHAANAHNDESARLDDFRRAEYLRLLEEDIGRCRFGISADERWHVVNSTPVCTENLSSGVVVVKSAKDGV
jgi:hypothetical protein